MTTPTGTAARSATLREGNGRITAIDELIDSFYTLLARGLDVHRAMIKSTLDIWAPMYSAAEEARRYVDDARRD